MQCSLNIYKIFGGKKFLRLVSKIMNLDQEKISENTDVDKSSKKLASMVKAIEK